MGLPERRYTDEQKHAMAVAVLDLGLMAKDVAARAAAGTLEHYGKPLPSFEVPRTSVPTYANRLKAQRERAAAKDAAEIPHRDQIEDLRRRLVTASDDTLRAWERQKPADRDVERGRQIARLIREAAAIPARTDPTPPKPGAKVNGERHGAETKGGPAGALLADHRRTTGHTQTQPAPPPPSTRGGRDATRGDHDASPDPTRDATTTEPTNHNQNHHEPGSAVRALADQLGHVLPPASGGVPTLG